MDNEYRRRGNTNGKIKQTSMTSLISDWQPHSGLPLQIHSNAHRALEGIGTLPHVLTCYCPLSAHIELLFFSEPFVLLLTSVHSSILRIRTDINFELNCSNSLTFTFTQHPFIDHLTARLGYYLRGSPAFRLFVILYFIFIHLFLMYILAQWSHDMGDQKDPHELTVKEMVESVNKVGSDEPPNQ